MFPPGKKGFRNGRSEIYQWGCLAEGVATRALPPIRAYNVTMHDTKLVVVLSYISRPEAELAKGALEAAGIQAIIEADSVGKMREHLAWSGAGFRILVREDDAAVARDVLTSPAEGGERSDADSETDDDSFSPWRKFT